MSITIAISGAKENGYLRDEALANKLAVKFYLGRGKEKIAHAFMPERLGLINLLSTQMALLLENARLYQDSLAESEEMFKFAAENTMVGLGLLQAGIIKYANPKFAAMFGYPLHDVVGMRVKDLVVPEDWPLVEEKIR